MLQSIRVLILEFIKRVSHLIPFSGVGSLFCVVVVSKKWVSHVWFLGDVRLFWLVKIGILGRLLLGKWVSHVWFLGDVRLFWLVKIGILGRLLLGWVLALLGTGWGILICLLLVVIIEATLGILEVGLVLLLLIKTTSMLRDIIQLPIILNLLIRTQITCLISRDILQTFDI